MYIDRPALFTDHYELTMAQGYFSSRRHTLPSTFDYFFRTPPFGGTFVIFSGLEVLLNTIEQFRFHKEDLEWLKAAGFEQSFLKYLADFRFSGSILSAREGDVVFPTEPVLRVEGGLLECQILETLLLNIINFHSLIATKASRIRYAAGKKKLADFGLRRAHGLGGIHATRAAYIGGFDATSNLYAAEKFHIPSVGTMAHSWVQAFDSELQAFRAYSDEFPDSCTLLIDTYDTLQSGLPNAIRVAKEMKARGQQLKAVRLDSGDLAYLSEKVRSALDRDGLHEVQIAASNQLDESVIHSLQSQDAPIDFFGVGTRLVTGQPDSALGGVYKISRIDDRDTFKLSENMEKMSLPGQKQVRRYLDSDGWFVGDAVCRADEPEPKMMAHPFIEYKQMSLTDYRQESLLSTVMTDGEIVGSLPTLEEIRTYSTSRLKQLDPSYRRFDNPHIYKVGITPRLKQLRDELLTQIETEREKSLKR